jgi:anti-sigma factor RsiW
MNDIAQHDHEWGERLQDLLDGDATHADRVALEAHLASCAHCRSQFTQLKRLDVQLRGNLETLTASASFDQQLFARMRVVDEREAERVRRRIETEFQQDLRSLSQRWRRNWISLLGGAFAGIAAAFALLSWIDAAGIPAAVAGAAHSNFGFGTTSLLHTLVLLVIGSVIGAVTARWLTTTVD